MNQLQKDAEQVEMLLPLLMRTLFRMNPDDPITSLPLAQLRVLRTLEAGPKPMGHLSEELGLSLSAVSQLVGRLVDAGYACVECDSHDRRKKTVLLAEKGREAMSVRKSARVSDAMAVLKRFRPEDRAAFITHLSALVEAGHSLFSPGGEPLALTEAIERSTPEAAHS